MTSRGKSDTVTSAAPEPFFTQDGEAPAGSRLLLVSYSFPPASEMGALRWEKLVAYGAGRGWGADVLSMDPDDASPRDNSRLASLPAGTRVYGVQLVQHPYLSAERRFRRLARWNGGDAAVRADRAAGDSTINITKPREDDRSLSGRLRALRRSQLAWLYYDEWRRWCDRATGFGVQLARENTYRLIVTCGPPHMAHEAGRRIAAATGLPMVMDLRDPWYGPSAEPWDVASPTWRRLTARYERACVEAAVLVVANTAAMEADLRERYPALGDRFITVMNGADPDVASTRPLSPCFTILHAGDLYNGRDPRSLLQGFRAAISELEATPDQIALRFLGAEHYEGHPLAQLAADAGVAQFVRAEAKVPRAAALRAQEESAMLVVLPQNQMECIPGKVFEYVQMSSWVLAIAVPGSATDLLLRDGTADVVEPGDIRGITRIISRRFREFTSGVRPVRVNADGRFDRAREAGRLFSALERVVASSPGSRRLP